MNVTVLKQNFSDSVTNTLADSYPNTIRSITFSLYESAVPVIKGRQQLQQNMISLITQGEKLIHIDGQPIHVKPEHILLLSAGNYLYTERFAGLESLTSILIFFDNTVFEQLTEMQVKHVHSKDEQVDKYAPFILFPKDDYLWNYIYSLQTLLKSKEGFSQRLQSVKLTELLLYLYGKHPHLFNSFWAAQPQTTEEQKILKVMRENVLNDLSVSELAFICNMSLPTFKRKFERFYHTSPAKWLQEQKLQIAADLLNRKKARPSDVYVKIGYENHSSFSKAFKNYYGVVPSAYAGQKPLHQNELLATQK